MTYTNDPANNIVDALRLEVGDTDITFPILSNEVYEYYYEKNKQAFFRTALDCAKAILFHLASNVYEKVDGIEVKGQEYFNNYKEALKLYIKNPTMGSMSEFSIYAGGISKQDFVENLNNPDNITVKVEKAIPVEGNASNINNSQSFLISNSDDYFSIKY